MISLLLVALIPLVITLGVYLHNPYSPVLNIIQIRTQNLPAVFSANNVLLSKVMDVYIKTAPAMAFIFFLSSFRILRIRKDNSSLVIIKTIVVFYIFYLVIVYALLFCNHEISTAGKLLRLISRNDYFLTFFYMAAYSSVYILSCMFFWISVGTYKELKDRH